VRRTAVRLQRAARDGEHPAIVDVRPRRDRQPRGDAARITGTTTLRALMPRFAELTASVVLHLGVLALCVAGVLPKPIATAAVLVPATFLWLTAALYRFGRALGAWPDEGGLRGGLLSRHGFWLVVINVLLYVPLLG